MNHNELGDLTQYDNAKGGRTTKGRRHQSETELTTPGTGDGDGNDDESEYETATDDDDDGNETLIDEEFIINCYFKPNDFIPIKIKSSNTVQELIDKIQNSNLNRGIVSTIKALDGTKLDNYDWTLSNYNIKDTTSIKVFSKIAEGNMDK